MRKGSNAQGRPAPGLVDPHGRKVEYLRISVTDRCNLRCRYCMPRGGVAPMAHGDILRYEELLEVVGAARALGIRRFRITGGEPLVRRGILWFLGALSERGVPYSITTNGLLLGQFARDLGRAGLAGINVGLDTLDRERFRQLTGADGLAAVLRGIDAARAEGIRSVKINVVVMRGVNEREADGFLAWARRERLDLRFVEFMPVMGKDLFVPLGPFIDALRERGEVEPAAAAGGGPAQCFRYRRGGGTVGFILPRSAPFCAECNRLRLTADGTLLPCLFSAEGVDIRGILRRGGSVAAGIEAAARAKPAGHGPKMRLSRYGMHALGG